MAENFFSILKIEYISRLKPTTFAEADVYKRQVREWQQKNPDKIEVIFNVFKDNDYEIYQRLLR